MKKKKKWDKKGGGKSCLDTQDWNELKGREKRAQKRDQEVCLKDNLEKNVPYRKR